MNVPLTPEAARVVQEHARMDSLIREGLASEASEMTDEDWDDIAREGAALIDARPPREA